MEWTTKTGHCAWLTARVETEPRCKPGTPPVTPGADDNKIRVPGSVEYYRRRRMSVDELVGFCGSSFEPRVAGFQRL